MKPQRPPWLPQVLQAQVQNLAVGLRPNTLQSYRAAVNSFLRYLHAEHPELRSPSRLRRDPHIIGWLRSLCERTPPLTNGTRLSYSMCLRRLLNDLADSGDHPVAEGLIRREDLPHPDEYLPKPLSPEDDDLLDRQLRSEDTLLSNTLLLLRATGMRIGECLHLATDSLRRLDQHHWALHVPLGKLHTERWIPVDDDVRQIYSRLLWLRQHSPAAASPFLLPQPSGHHAAYFAVRKALKISARRAGCSVCPTPHQLRHGFATEMIRAGVSLPALMQLLGHKSLRMTLRYIQVTDNDLQSEYRQARQNLATRYALPQFSPVIAATGAGIPAIADSLIGIRRLLDAHLPQYHNSAAQSVLRRLSKRLAKIARQLDQLPADAPK